MAELAKAYVQIVPTMSESGGGSLTQLFNSSGVSSQADSAGKSIGGSFLGGLGGAISAGAGAVIGGIAAVGGAFTDAIGNVASYGDSIDKMSQKMGMSAQAYQEWDAVMQHSGTSMETMKAGMKTLANAVANGNEAFQKIGLTQEQIASMSQEELFGATIKGLQNVDNETERTYLAGQLLGRGATELGALLNTSAEDTDKMRQRVHELGGVMSDEAVKAAAAYQDSLQDMQTAFSGLSRNLLAEFLPSVTGVMNGLTEIFAGNSEEGIGMITAGIKDLLNGIGEVLPQFATMATQIITAIAEAIIQNLPQIVESGLGILATLAGSLMENLPLIGESILGVIDVIINTLTEYGPTLLEQGFNMIMNLAMGIIENAPAAADSLSEAVSQGLALLEEKLPDFLDKGMAAIEQLATGIIENLPAVITSMGEITMNLISFLMEHMPDYLQKGIELLQNIGQGIMDNLPEILGTMAGVLADLIAGIAEKLPDFLQKGLELLGEIGAGLIQAIPDLLAKLPEIFDSILNELGSYDWLSIGANIINGIAEGVTSFAKNLADAAISAVGDAWDGICGWLGIASPSKRARDIIGKNWAAGIGVGFEAEMPDTTADMTATTRRTMDVLSGTIANPRISAARAVEGDNSGDVIAAISDLKQAIMSMQIIMDSGEVVGAIQEPINGALGREAQRAVWQ